MHRQFFEGIATLSLAMTSKKKYVILSVSEISHDQREKYILCGNSPSREIASSFHFLAKTNKKVCHRER